MKIAYVITAHAFPAQFGRLVSCLSGPDAGFFVHIDRKTPEETYERFRQAVDGIPNVHFVRRHRAMWGSFGIVAGNLECLKAAMSASDAFDYFVYLTAQDYPIKSNAAIRHTLERADGRTFLRYHRLPYYPWDKTGGRRRYQYWHIRKYGINTRLPARVRDHLNPLSLNRSPLLLIANLFLPKQRNFIEGFDPVGGWAHFCMARKHVQYVLELGRSNPGFQRYFQWVNIPDEMFFQTALLNSPHADEIVNDDLRYIDWSEGAPHPKILTHEDYPALAASDALFARKFNAEIDSTVLTMIDEGLRQSP